MHQISAEGADSPERFLTLEEAANALGLPVWKLRRAAKTGIIPSYQILNTRRLVKLGEILAIIESSRQGGAS